MSPDKTDYEPCFKSTFLFLSLCASRRIFASAKSVKQCPTAENENGAEVVDFPTTDFEFLKVFPTHRFFLISPGEIWRTPQVRGQLPGERWMELSSS